jgi:hypothetical protein
MATISATSATTGYVPPGFVFGIGQTTAQTNTNNLATVGQIRGTAGLTLSIFHVTAVANAETITIGGMHNAVACAWQPEDIGDDGDTSVLVNVASAATGNRGQTGTTFTFYNGGTRQGWLWVLHGN